MWLRKGILMGHNICTAPATLIIDKSCQFCNLVSIKFTTFGENTKKKKKKKEAAQSSGHQQLLHFIEVFNSMC